ncbi:hypothetical protein ONZ45_g13829 [Pleurotus djamor]|nr:hypothetical protein ONZ45_g13829 [Pleurotus djamor]
MAILIREEPATYGEYDRSPPRNMTGIIVAILVPVLGTAAVVFLILRIWAYVDRKRYVNQDLMGRHSEYILTREEERDKRSRHRRTPPGAYVSHIKFAKPEDLDEEAVAKPGGLDEEEVSKPEPAYLGGN